MLNCLLLSNNKTRVSEFNKQTMFLSIVGPRGSIGDFPIQGHMIIFTDSGSDGNTSYSTSSFSSPLSLAKGGIDLKSLLENGGITLTLSSTGINVGSSLDDIDLHVRLIFFSLFTTISNFTNHGKPNEIPPYTSPKRLLTIKIPHISFI